MIDCAHYGDEADILQPFIMCPESCVSLMQRLVSCSGTVWRTRAQLPSTLVALSSSFGCLPPLSQQSTVSLW